MRVAVSLLPLLAALLGCAAATEVICYWGSWSHYRNGAGKVTAEDLDPHKCTIYIYSFAKLNPTTYKMEMFDTWLDSDLKNYERFMALKQKNPALKLLIALGGWNDSRHSKYSQLLASPSRRKAFITSAIEFIQRHGFDGLDLDYEYPTAADKPHFAAWVTELKEKFQPLGLMLSAAVPTHSYKIDAGYDVPTVAAALDFINVMAYDMHGPWEASADNHAAFQPRASDAGSGLDIQSVMAHWMRRGAPAAKLAMGVPLYGKTWTVPGMDKTPPAPASGPGRAGPHTREAGTLSYHEICEKINAGWTVVPDPSGKIGPYAYSGDQWVGYDDAAMVAAKTQWAVSQGFGAVMVWDVGYEDVRNTCGGGAWPLMSVILSSLGDNGTSTTTTTPATITTTSGSTTTTSGSTTTTSGTTTTTTTSAGTTTTPSEGSGQAICSTSNGVVPDPNDCSRYYSCGGGVGHHFKCPAGTLFDSSLKYCNWAHLVSCSTSTGGTTTSAPVTTTSKTTTTSAPVTTTTSRATTSAVTTTAATAATAATTTANPGSFSCPAAYGWYADPVDCSRFYRCLNGVADHKKCPKGTAWQQSISNCNWATIVGCSIDP